MDAFNFFPTPETPDAKVKSLLSGKSPYFYTLPSNIQLLIEHDTKSYDQIFDVCQDLYENLPSSTTEAYSNHQKEVRSHETLAKILGQDRSFAYIRSALIAAAGVGTTPAVTLSVCHTLLTIACGEMSTGKALTMLNSHTPLIMCLKSGYANLSNCEPSLKPLLASVFPPEDVMNAINHFSMSAALVIQSLMEEEFWQHDTTPIQYLVEYGDDDANAIAIITEYYTGLLGKFTKSVMDVAQGKPNTDPHPQMTALNNLNRIIATNTQLMFGAL